MIGEVQLIVCGQVVFFTHGPELFCRLLVVLDEVRGKLMARAPNIGRPVLSRGLGVDYFCNGVPPLYLNPRRADATHEEKHCLVVDEVIDEDRLNRALWRELGRDVFN